MSEAENGNIPRCTLSDEDLADKLTVWAINLAKTGGKAWSLRVPVDLNYDPDILMIEAANRVRIRAEAVKEERERCKRILENIECVNGNETEIRRQDAIEAILSDTMEATTH